MVECEDKLNFQDNAAINNKIGDEKIYFSDRIQKKTAEMFSKTQERNIVITDLALYNFKGTEIKRRIIIEDLKAITISKISNQFIVHGNQNEYDYLYIYPDRKKITKVLQNIYENKTGKDLLFCKKNDKELSKFVVTKKEKIINPYIFKIEQHELTSIKDYIEGDVDIQEEFENPKQSPPPLKPSEKVEITPSNLKVVCSKEERTSPPQIPSTSSQPQQVVASIDEGFSFNKFDAPKFEKSIKDYPNANESKKNHQNNNDELNNLLLEINFLDNKAKEYENENNNNNINFDNKQFDEVSKLKSKINILENKIKEYENEKNNLNNKLKEKEKEFNGFKLKIIEYENKINNLNRKLNYYENENINLKNNNIKLLEKIKNLENKIKAINRNNIDSNNDKEQIITLLKTIQSKDNEIKELKLKMPYILENNEKLMTIIFISLDQKIHYSFICKNSDKFNKIENLLYEKYPEFLDYENYFTVNGNKINKYRTIEENKINNSDIIVLTKFE